jgi:hypothetical protein
MSIAPTSAAQIITHTNTGNGGNGLEVTGSSSGNAYALYARASAFSRSISVLANGQGGNLDSWGLAITRGASDNTDDGLNSDHLRFRGTRNNIGSNRYIAIEPASLGATRTYTLPDAGANAAFVMTQGNQTIAGTKTFSSTISGSVTGSAGSLTTNAGSSTNPIHFSSGVPVASTATVGSGTRPIFLNSGTITQSSSSIGSATQPVYLNNGVITATDFYVKEAATDIYIQRIFTASALTPGGPWTNRYDAGSGNGLLVSANDVGVDYLSGFYNPSGNDRFLFDIRVGTSDVVIKAVVYSQWGSSTSNENNSAVISFSTINSSGHIVQYSFRWKTIVDNSVRFINLGGARKITFK